MLLSADEQRRTLESEIEARKHAEVELRQAQKLEAVGRLASGVAHEINTPLQFVTNMAQFMSESLEQLLQAVVRIGDLARGFPSPLTAEIDKTIEALDVPYLREKVLLNLIVNAAHAAADGGGKGASRSMFSRRSSSRVVDRHGGKLTFESTPGVGTTFFVRLPIAEDVAQAA